MTLEQRIEALEKAVSNLTQPSSKTEELAKMMRDVASEKIKNARRPGVVLHNEEEKATERKVASFSVDSGLVFINPAVSHGATVKQCHK